jgi:glycosyltransferase involved in cell wall biosynthesis
VVVVSLTGEDSGRQPEYDFVTVRIRREGSRSLRVAKTTRLMARFAAGADVVFANGLYLESMVGGWLARRPVVQKVVGDWAWEQASNRGYTEATFDEFQGEPGDVRVGLLKAARSVCLRRADHIIVPSDYLRQWLTRLGVATTKTSVIHNACPRFDEVSAMRIPVDAPVRVVVVGRLVKHKRVDGLIRAIGEVPGVGLIVVGEGPERGNLEEMVRREKLKSRVVFCGVKSRLETIAIMAGSDLLALNSTYEGFPHVVVEAMAVGLPVVATAAGGTVELIRHQVNGILVPVSDGGCITKVLASLAADAGERMRLSAGARGTASELSEEGMIRRTEAVVAASVGGRF